MSRIVGLKSALIEFNVANFLSIKEKQTLSMVAANWIKEQKGRLIEGIKGTPILLPAIVIYGANASGKTNLLKALAFMRWFVLNSQQKMQDGDLIAGIAPFLFNKNCTLAPSEFEIIFINNNVRYQYGFSATQKKVISEWLLAYPKGLPQRWFTREYDKKKNQYNWKFSDKFKGGKQRGAWRDATRPNSLFLAAAIQMNNEQLKPVFEWFKKLFTVNLLSEIRSLQQCLKDEKRKKEILNFIKAADPSLNELHIKKTEAIKHPLFRQLPKNEQQKFLKNSENKNFIEIYSTHINNDGETADIGFSDESNGTQNFFALASYILDALTEGNILIIDEINISLHPLLMRKLIYLFHDPDINKHHAQLIFSTHDTSILDKNFFRRDQIWFTEKDQTNATTVYPLTDFIVRQEEALGKGYLKGRYGAIPYFCGELIDYGD